MPDTPHVRVGHYSPDAPAVDVRVDGERAFEAVAFKDMTDYAELESGKHHVEVVPTGGTEPVVDVSLDIEDNTKYTGLATGLLSSLELTVLTDDPGQIPRDQAELRCVHAVPDAPAVHIQDEHGERITSNLRFRTAGDYEMLAAGEHDIEIVTADSGDTVIEVDGVTFDDQTAYTAVAAGQLADSSLDVALFEDAQQMIPADDD